VDGGEEGDGFFCSAEAGERHRDALDLDAGADSLSVSPF
jgi:hypothetical protein